MHCSAKQSSRIFSASHTCVFVSKETCCCSRFNQKCLEFSIFSPWRNYFELDLDPTLEILLSKDFTFFDFTISSRRAFYFFVFYIHNRKHASQIHRGGLCHSNDKTQTDFHRSGENETAVFPFTNKHRVPTKARRSTLNLSIAGRSRRTVQSKPRFARWKVRRFNRAN